MLSASLASHVVFIVNSFSVGWYFNEDDETKWKPYMLLGLWVLSVLQPLHALLRHTPMPFNMRGQMQCGRTWAPCFGRIKEEQQPKGHEIRFASCVKLIGGVRWDSTHFEAMIDWSRGACCLGVLSLFLPYQEAEFDRKAFVLETHVGKGITKLTDEDRRRGGSLQANSTEELWVPYSRTANLIVKQVLCYIILTIVLNRGITVIIQTWIIQKMPIQNAFRNILTLLVCMVLTTIDCGRIMLLCHQTLRRYRYTTSKVWEALRDNRQAGNSILRLQECALWISSAVVLLIIVHSITVLLLKVV